MHKLTRSVNNGEGCNSFVKYQLEIMESMTTDPRVGKIVKDNLLKEIRHIYTYIYEYLFKVHANRVAVGKANGDMQVFDLYTVDGIKLLFDWIEYPEWSSCAAYRSSGAKVYQLVRFTSNLNSRITGNLLLDRSLLNKHPYPIVKCIEELDAVVGMFKWLQKNNAFEVIED
jgi:hypothetical protein